MHPSVKANVAPPASLTAYLRLKEMIYTGELAAGKRIVERDLCEVLSISRIPLREAFVRLQAEGLIRSVRNTASFVVDFSPGDILEIYSIRRLIEPFAARLATKNITPDILQELRVNCERMTKYFGQEPDWSKLDECDYEFHRTIVRASQHSRLIRAYDMIQIRILGRKDEYQLLKSLSRTAMALEHNQIIDVIESRNAAKAEKAAYNHVNRSMEDFLKSYGLTNTMD
jgi:DNA-binding GntR family transcriptional regulator